MAPPGGPRPGSSSSEPDQLLRVALELPDWERDEICRRLGERSAVIRCASRWSGWFVPLFATGMLAVLAGVLVAVLGGPFWLAALLLPAGVTAAGAPAIKIWQVTWQMLDIAVAATVCAARSRDQVCLLGRTGARGGMCAENCRWSLVR